MGTQLYPLQTVFVDGQVWPWGRCILFSCLSISYILVFASVTFKGYLISTAYLNFLFELPLQVKAIELGTNNICLYKENRKKNIAYEVSADLSLKCTLVR